MKIQPVRGTHDLYGQQLFKFRLIEDLIKQISHDYKFKEIVTPIFESTELFRKPLGELSDVVLKEMYTFKDRNNSYLTLRPEYTTPMLRAAISNNFLNKLPQKLYGIGPMFRRERPQKGRYRQFNQINFEILGTFDVMADVELILLADNILKKLLPNKKIDLHINSLGDHNTLKVFKDKLTLYFKRNEKNLSEDSKSKINTNPLRILDSKNQKDEIINQNAPKISDFYSKDANIRFLDIQNLLSNVSLKFTVNNNLVRGLDYYCHTVFEFKTNDLGKQDTLIGGGRYDGLIKSLGGPEIPGVGWAGGIERLTLLMDDLNKNNTKVHLVILDQSLKPYGLVILNQLRRNKISTNFDFKYNLKKSLSLANEESTEYAIIIGENEFNKGMCTLKNLNNNTQEMLNIDEIIKKLLI